MSDTNNNPYAQPPGGSAQNPYAAPKANVALEADGPQMGGLIENGRRVPAGRGLAWITEGFAVFMQSPGIWMAVAGVYFLLSMVAAAVPFLGSLAVMLLTPVILAGILLGCHALDQGEPLDVSYLFAGFKENVGQLVMIGLFYLLGLVIIMVGLGLVIGLGFAGMFAGGLDKADNVLFGVLAMTLVVLVAIGVSIPLLMAVWFAPALVVFHQQEAISAMKQSFAGCLKNVVPFLIYGVLTMLLSILATLPVMLGWLVLGPVIFGGWYRSYRDIYAVEA